MCYSIHPGRARREFSPGSGIGESRVVPKSFGTVRLCPGQERLFLLPTHFGECGLRVGRVHQETLQKRAEPVNAGGRLTCPLEKRLWPARFERIAELTSALNVQVRIEMAVHATYRQVIVKPGIAIRPASGQREPESIDCLRVVVEKICE